MLHSYNMERVWSIPEELWGKVGDEYRAQHWDNLVWYYNHYKVGGPRKSLCFCTASHGTVKIIFEKFGDIYGDEPGGDGMDKGKGVT